MGKKWDLSDFERGMVVGARRAGLTISKTADLLGFSRITVAPQKIYAYKVKRPTAGDVIQWSNLLGQSLSCDAPATIFYILFNMLGHQWPIETIF